MDEFPGYLGWTSRGVIAIHADWPAYPLEHGWDIALTALGMFPRGTTFRAIDDIDQCLLFVAEINPKEPVRDNFDERNFHVALWHEDLLDLARQGLIAGSVTSGTELTHTLNVYRAATGLPPVAEWSGGASAEVPELFAQTPDGELIPVPLPAPDDYDDDDRLWVVRTEPVSINDHGWMELEKQLASHLKVPEDLRERVEHLIERGQFDTAVREIGAALETRMRSHLNSTSYGLKLVEEFIAEVRASRAFIEAYVKVVRTELRTAFKFERNHYAHRLVEVPRPQGLALVSRLLFVYMSAGRMIDSLT